MQFQVPQFIEVEDKIFGQLTIKQFIYLAAGAGLTFIIIRFMPNIFLGVIVALPFIALAIALAFYQPNKKQSFIVLLENAFMYTIREKLYIWRKQDKKPVPSEKRQEKDAALLYVPKLADSKLKDMTWTLDVSEALNPVTRSNQKTQ